MSIQALPQAVEYRVSGSHRTLPTLASGFFEDNVLLLIPEGPRKVRFRSHRRWDEEEVALFECSLRVESMSDHLGSGGESSDDRHRFHGVS
jgi:hypothetical protein